MGLGREGAGGLDRRRQDSVCSCHVFLGSDLGKTIQLGLAVWKARAYERTFRISHSTQDKTLSTFEGVPAAEALDTGMRQPRGDFQAVISSYACASSAIRRNILGSCKRKKTWAPTSLRYIPFCPKRLISTEASGKGGETSWQSCSRCYAWTGCSGNMFLPEIATTSSITTTAPESSGYHQGMKATAWLGGGRKGGGGGNEAIQLRGQSAANPKHPPSRLRVWLVRISGGLVVGKNSEKLWEC